MKTRKPKDQMETAVFNCSKQKLWKVVKTNCPRTLDQNTRWVMRILNPDVLYGWPDDEMKEEACELWIERYREEVRLGLIDKMGYVKEQLIKKFVGPGDKWNPHGLPETATEVEELVLRLGMGDEDPDHEAKRTKWLKLNDHMIPAVSNSYARHVDSGARSSAFGGSSLQSLC